MKAAWLCAPLLLIAAALPAPDPQTGGGSLEAREHLRRGIELARQGLHEGAVAELQSAVGGLPNDPDAWFQLGRSLMEVARRNKTPLRPAIDALETALRLDSSRDYVRIQLAQVYGQRLPGSFKPEAAIKLYEDLIQRHPDSPEAHLNFALWLITAEIRLARTGDPSRVLQDSAWTMDLARFHLEKAIDMAPRDSDTSIDARTYLGEVQFRSGEWDAARAIYEQLIAQLSEMPPSRPVNLAPAWDTIAHCRWRRKQYAESLAAARKAYDLSPALPYLWDIKTACDGMGGCPPDLPARYRFPLREENYDRAAPPLLRFTDIAARLHINKLAGAGPAGWADYNGDGRLDLIACGCDTYCTLYKAEGDTFSDATIAAQLAHTEPGFGSVWGDYDNDGDPDLYISRNGWNGPAPNSLLRNNGDGTFSDVGSAAHVADPGSSFNATWVDYDRDGWLDLIVTNGVYIDGSTNQLYHNERDGTFTNVTKAAGLAEEPLFGTIGVAAADYDDDGWIDIFYHGRMTTNRLYHNNHDGTFTNVAAQAGVAGPGTQNGYIALAVDFDADGDLDLFTASLAPWEHVLAGYQPGYKPGPLDNIPRFYRNNGGGTFTDESLSAGLRYPLGIMAGSAADLDNDGYPDILLGTGNPELRRTEPNIFYWNKAGKGFEDLTRYTGLGSLCKGHGISFLDWDRDGDLDAFAELGGSSTATGARAPSTSTSWATSIIGWGSRAVGAKCESRRDRRAGHRARRGVQHDHADHRGAGVRLHRSARGALRAGQTHAGGSSRDPLARRDHAESRRRESRSAHHGPARRRAAAMTAGAPSAHAAPVLEMRGVTRSFARGPERVEALRGVTLSVGRGEIVAIVGSSGSGKTTLLNLAGGVDRPDSGEILLAGRRVDALPEGGRTLLRRGPIGMIFQECHLVEELTVAQNVALPLLFAGRPGADGLIRDLLAEVEISERRAFHPGQLSGGERQRAAIARALVCAPALLLADEPTGSLDSAQAERIFDLFRALAQRRGLALLLATHNRELARRADRVLRLHDGVLAAG